MRVREIFETIRKNDKNVIKIQFRDENDNFICDTYIHALGIRPYLDCEVKEWEPFVRKIDNGTEMIMDTQISIVANIRLEEPGEKPVFLEKQLQMPQQTEEVIKEAKTVIKESKEVIKQAPKAAGQKDFAQAPKKEKICELCGKPFHPNSGVQKYCASCKKLKDDIKKTAQELLEG